MRRTGLLLTAVAVSMLVLGGCKGKQGTPKGLLEKMHTVSEKTDSNEMLECIEPDAQKNMKDVIPLLQELQDSAKKAADVVEKKISKNDAEFLKVICSINSPLSEVSKDGEIDWSKVNITEDGDKASFELNGKKSSVNLKKVDGKWYVAIPEDRRLSEAQAKKEIELLKKKIAAIKELTTKVNDGKVTKANWNAEFGKVMGGL